MQRVTFILHPGFIRSKHDGDTHYITADRLRDLYQLRRWPKARVMIAFPGDRRGHTLIGFHLYPDYSGKYRLPDGVPAPRSPGSRL